MPREKKEEALKNLEELFSASTSIIFTDYRGMPVSEMTQLRRKLRELGVQYHVAKNTLTLIAAERKGKTGLDNILQGPTALVYSSGEVAVPAKALADYLGSTKTSLSIKGALVRQRVLRREEVLELARLPSQAALIAKLLGQMKAPLVSLSFVLGANLRKLLAVLEARKAQLEGGAAP